MRAAGCLLIMADILPPLRKERRSVGGVAIALRCLAVRCAAMQTNAMNPSRRFVDPLIAFRGLVGEGALLLCWRRQARHHLLKHRPQFID
jgi:hypothetical protein